MSGRKASPCIYCNGPKEAGQGRRVCKSCEETRKPLILQQQTKDRQERRRLKQQASWPEGRKKAPEGQKWCALCAEYRSLDNFGTRGGKRLAAYCRPCSSIYAHENTLRKQYGITLDDYLSLFEIQDGRCAICQTQPRKRRLSVDHDHETGKVRGLLCTRCNHKLLGAAHDSAAMLRRAAAYLGAPPNETRQPIPSTNDDLLSLLMSEWIGELESAKTFSGAQIGALWIESPGKSPAEGHVVLSMADYEKLCSRIDGAA